MTTSRKSAVLSQIEGDNPIDAGVMAYLCERARNNYFDFVIEKFKDAEQEGLTKADLARRIGKSPDRISHLLGAPGNWTLDTITELLVGISREEVKPASEPFLGRLQRNYGCNDAINVHRSNVGTEASATTIFVPNFDIPSIVEHAK